MTHARVAAGRNIRIAAEDKRKKAEFRSCRSSEVAELESDIVCLQNSNEKLDFEHIVEEWTPKLHSSNPPFLLSR
jgi:hypothetical protein